MSFTLPWTVNKLVSTNINAANSITGGAYGDVSLKVGGKTQLVGDTVIEGSVGIGMATTSNKLDVAGDIGCSNVICDSVDAVNHVSCESILTTQEVITPIPNPVTIANWNFGTPAQASTNTFQVITTPYTAITGWTITNTVGTPFQICIMRGFAQFINTYDYLYPDYPAVTQAIGISQTTVPQTTIVNQNITFTKGGTYQLSFWIWGTYNTYRTTQTITASINGYSQQFKGVEQLWTKCLVKFQIPSAGTYNLSFNWTNTYLNSVLCMTNVKIEEQHGLVISDGGVVNNQFVNSTGLFTTAIENRGPLTNYGYLKNYGALGLFAPYSNGTVVIGTSSYGTVNPADGGSGTVLIGSSNAVQSPSVALTLNYCVGIGMGALEQVGAGNRLHAIGYRCMRWNGNVSDNVGYGFGAGEHLGYSGSSSNRNVAIGNYTMNGRAASSNDNVVIGHNAMSSANFTNGCSFNACVGGTSFTNLVSNYNSSFGYGSANNIVNLASTYNTFVGAQVCPGQNGATNVMTNCTFLGATSNVSPAGTYTASTAVGYGAIITGSNQIILGRATETTFAMGGLTVPVAELLTILGNITANSLVITPAQLSILNQVVSGQLPASAISGISGAYVDLVNNQTINGIKTFVSAPVMSGSSISSGTIPVASVSGTAVNLSSNQSITGIKTFSTNPVFNTNAIPETSVNGTAVNLSSNQSITGIKTFSTNPVFNTNAIPLNTLEDVYVGGVYNLGIGKNALQSAGATLDECTAIGDSSQANNIDGLFTTSCGSFSFFNLKNGCSYNTAVGSNAGYNIGSGCSFNCIIGSDSCYPNTAGPDISLNYCSTLGHFTLIEDTSQYVTVIGCEAEQTQATHGNNAIVLGREGFDNTWIQNNLYLYGSLRLRDTFNTIVTKTALRYISTLTSDAQTQITALNTITTGISYSSPNTTISNTLFVNTIDGISTGTLTLGINTGSGVNIAGEIYVKNNAQKINGYSTLSGTPNVLTKPLSEYYTLSTTANGSLQLPVIDATMYGSQITFTKTSADATWTINRGGTDTFRLYKSNNTATTTSVLMEYTKTVLRIVATQGGIWDIISTDVFYNAASDWVIGTQYFRMLMGPTNITASINWFTSFPPVFYGVQGFSITATSLITLPQSTNINVPDGLRISFRRTGGTATIVLQFTASAGDTVRAYNSFASTAAGTAATLVPASVYSADLYLNKTAKVWYAM